MKDLRENNKKKNLRAKDPIKQILDENNDENVVLYDDENKPIEFEQVALIENKDKLYAILIPITPMVGVGEGEGVCFLLDEQKGDLSVVTNEKTIDEVLEIYQKLLEESGEEE